LARRGRDAQVFGAERVQHGALKAEDVFAHVRNKVLVRVVESPSLAGVDVFIEGFIENEAHVPPRSARGVTSKKLLKNA
jgi:hypothetical protein